MSILHVKSDTIADFTGTVTVLNSQGSTTTVGATNLVRPSDWNSQHNFSQTISGNTSGTSTAVGTDYVYGFTGDITGSHSTAASAATLWVSAPQRYLQNYENIVNILSNGGNGVGGGSWLFQAFTIPNWYSGGALHIPLTPVNIASIMKDSSANFASNTTGSYSNRLQFSLNAALYSYGAGTNSSRIESFWSNLYSHEISHSGSVASGGATTVSASVGGTITYFHSIDASGNVTTTSTSATGSSSSGSSSLASANVSSILNSARQLLKPVWLPVPFNTTIPPGGYVLAVMWNTASTTNGTSQIEYGANAFNFVLSQSNVYQPFGATTTVSNHPRNMPYAGMVYSVTSAAPPTTVVTADLRTIVAGQSISGMSLPFAAIGSGMATTGL